MILIFIFHKDLPPFGLDFMLPKTCILGQLPFVNDKILFFKFIPGSSLIQYYPRVDCPNQYYSVLFWCD